jgi:methylated-DNA-[protein]-cysteine S-methyltransferase
MVATKGSHAAYRQRATLGPRERQVFVKAFDTRLRWMAIAWRDDVLLSAAFGHSSQRQAEVVAMRSLGMTHASPALTIATRPDDVPGWVSELVDDIQRFAEGEPVDFSHVVLDLEHLTPFANRVVAACRRIHWGRTRSYGELAEESGAPGAARAVGTVMAKNRFPLIVPCHRVLAAGGAIGGYSAPDGLAMKRKLLAMEQTNDSGVAIVGPRGRK